MYTFDEKFKKGAARAFRAQQGLTAFLSGLNRILPEPPGFKTEKPKDKREDTIRIADTAGDSWYLGFSERSITPSDIDAKNYYIGGNLSAPPRRVRGDCSPSTQRIASLILDLPLPFGPTTAVMPSPKRKTVLSGKDLKPCSSNDLSNNGAFLL